MSISIEVHPFTTRVYGIPFDSPVEQYVQRQVGHYTPDPERHPKVKSGQWDGWISLLSRDYPYYGVHTVPTGLVPTLVEHLAKCQAPMQFFNAVPPVAADPALYEALRNAPGYETRPYQEDAIEAVTGGIWMPEVQLHLPRLGGIIQAGTGAGKSIMAAELVRRGSAISAVSVSSTDLMEQMIKHLQRCLGTKVGFIGDSKCELRQVNVVMNQTLYAHQKSLQDPQARVHKFANEIDWVTKNSRVAIFDEVHGIAANTNFKVASMFSGAGFVLGLSASPWRDDGLDALITAACGPVMHKISASELIRLGWLVPPTVTIHELPPPPGASMGVGFGDFDQVYRDFVSENERFHDYVSTLCYQHEFAGETVLVLVKHAEHGKKLQERIPKSIFVEGKVSTTRRTKIWKALESKEVMVVIATTLADQGLDIPSLDALVLCGGGRSTTRALQRVGRTIRTSDGKNRLEASYTGKCKATVHEFRHKHPTLEKHFAKRMQMYGMEDEFKYARISATY